MESINKEDALWELIAEVIAYSEDLMTKVKELNKERLAEVLSVGHATLIVLSDGAPSKEIVEKLITANLAVLEENLEKRC